MGNLNDFWHILAISYRFSLIFVTAEIPQPAFSQDHDNPSLVDDGAKKVVVLLKIKVDVQNCAEKIEKHHLLHSNCINYAGLPRSSDSITTTSDDIDFVA